MRCPTCNHDNDDTKKFCTQCGAVLGGRRCPQGHTIPEGLSECPFCPRPVRPPTVDDAPSGRKGTALVSDEELKGSGVVPSSGQPPSPRPPVGERGRTMFVPAGQAAPATPQAAAPVPNTGSAPLIGFLVSFSDDKNGRFWPLRYGRTAIGADPACDVSVQGPAISGRHAEVMARDNNGVPKVWLTDLNSTNGTRLNGNDIFTDRPDLQHGDRVSVGACELQFVQLPRA